MDTEIKTRDGSINAALTTGIIGTAGVLLGALGHGTGSFSRNSSNSSTEYVTKTDFEMGQALAAKDSEIAILKADATTNTKIIDTYKEIMGKVNELGDKVLANKDFQTGVNMQQVAYNATNNANYNCLQNQVAQLYSMTALKIPATNVCPLPQPAPLSAY